MRLTNRTKLARVRAVPRKQQRSCTKVSDKVMELLGSCIDNNGHVERIEDEYAKREGGA